MDSKYDVGEKQCLLQSYEETRKFKAFIALPPEVVHWHKGKTLISIPTANGAITVYGGQVAGVDDKGNVLIGVDDDAAIWAGSENGSKGLSAGELGQLAGGYEGNVPTIGLGDLRHVNPHLDLPEFPPSDIVEPDIKPLLEPQPPMPKPEIESQFLSPEPLKEPQFEKPRFPKEPNLNGDIPDIYMDHLKQEERHFEKEYYNSVKDIPKDWYKNCKNVLNQIELPQELKNDMKRRDMKDAFEAKRERLKSFGFHDEQQAGMENEQHMEL